MNDDKPSVPKAVEDCHALIEWMIPKLDGFPRNRRFTLGEHIETGLLFVQERLVEAAYLRKREEVLRVANLWLDVVRHLWRLSHGLKVSPMPAIAGACYGQGAERMTDLGRQIGGWRRHVGQAAEAP
jgi:hypothetical protein